MSLLRLALGFICGVVATGPMSVAMVLLHRRLPARERYPLPPREITNKAVAKLVEPGDRDPLITSALTWVAHFAYGGAAGALYTLAERRLPGRAAVRGPIFGMVVWTVSYLGLLPSVGVLTPATEHPIRRSALMIVAHIIWGFCNAAVFKILFSDLSRQTTAFHNSPRLHRDTRRQPLQK